MTAIKAEDHIGIVNLIAQTWAKRSGLEFDELRQEGVIGLMTAVRKFDPTFEVPFATYAFWWVSSSISRYLRDKTRVIKLPTRSKVREKMSQVGELPRVVKSLDKRIYSDDETATLHDKISDESDPVDIAASAGELSEKIWGLLSSYPERTQKVIKMIYVDGLTTDQVGEELGISRQRVHQIQQKTLRELKPKLSKFL